MHPITEVVAENFQKEKKGAVKVTVGISGTGGGFAKFCKGEIDIVNASRPIQRKEIKACDKARIEYVELPVAFDPVTVVVNPQNSWANSMTVEELKKIWEPSAEGKITRWRQVNPAWPDEPFRLYGAGADSGTFDYFTRAIVGKTKSSRRDFMASEDDNVLVQSVLPATKMPWASSAMDITSRTRTSSERSRSIMEGAKGCSHPPKRWRMEPISL